MSPATNSISSGEVRSRPNNERDPVKAVGSMASLRPRGMPWPPSPPRGGELMRTHPERGYLKCAALCYGFMLDLDGSTAVADAARQFGFSNPCSNRTFEELPRDTPLFVARAGRDEFPGLNGALDSFVAGGRPRQSARDLRQSRDRAARLRRRGRQPCHVRCHQAGPGVREVPLVGR